MSISDSSFTNPDSLRARYINPRNVLLNLDEQASGESQAAGDGAALVINQPSNQSSPIFQQPRGQYGCPAVGQFVIARSAQGKPLVKLAETVISLKDYLYNPITKTFHKVVHAEIIKDQECALIRTFDDAAQIVSFSHPVITNFADKTGTLVSDIIPHQERSAGAVSVIDFIANENSIDAIYSVGRRDVVHIALEDGFIYASGVNPMRMIVGHNKPIERGDPLEPLPEF